MMTAVRQTVTVQAGGRLELVAPDLVPGTIADVIVLVPSNPLPPLANDEWLDLLRQYQQAAALTPEAAAAWSRQIRLEREAWPLDGDPVG